MDVRHAGWTQLVGGSAPGEIAKTQAALKAHFSAFGSSAFPADGWTVEPDGSLHEHGGPDLISKETYGDFEMELEWKAALGGNSGVFYRIQPMAGQPIYENAFECQILGPADMTKVASVYRPGALYNLYGCQSPQVAMPVGQWNHMRIQAHGNHLVHYLNGVKVVDCWLNTPDYAKHLAHSKFAKVPGYGQQASGPIGLQSDGGEVWYRNVRIRAN